LMEYIIIEKKRYYFSQANHPQKSKHQLDRIRLCLQLLWKYHQLSSGA